MNVVILGSTGSIGTQAIQVIEEHPDQFKLIGLAAKSNEATLMDQVHRFNVAHFSLFDRELPGSVGFGIQSLNQLVQLEEADVIIMAVSGAIGLEPSISAIKAKKRLALASKEVLVLAGEIVMKLARSTGAEVLPIDSEHSAIFQCLQGVSMGQLAQVILTASGGPFRGMNKSQLESVTLEQALKHPTWTMGSKITIDSATLMNKALEWIEAKWLFRLKNDQIEAVIHPQSLIHSMVRLVDGSVLAQMGWPSMKLPILYSLTYPNRVENDLKRWNPSDSPVLNFEPIDHEAFPSLTFAQAALEAGGTMASRLNAGNEELVALFLRSRIKLVDIFRGIEQLLGEPCCQEVTLESLIDEDKRTRIKVQEWAQLRC